MAAVNGDGLAMNTGLTRMVMDQLNQVAAAFEAGWSASESSIVSLASQLGNGPMGRAFRGNFDPAAERTATVANLLVGRVSSEARIGGHIVTVYEAADAASAQAVKDVT